MSSNSTTKRDTARKPPSKHRPTKAEMEGVMAIDATLDRLAGAAPADGAARRQPKRTESDAARIRLRVPRGSRDRTRDGVSRREQRSGARNVRALCKPGRGVERHRHRSPCGTGSSRPGPIRQGTQVYRPLHESLSIASSPARGARPGCRAQACRIPPRWLPRRMRFSRNNALVPALPLPPGIRSDRQVPSRSRPAIPGADAGSGHCRGFPGAGSCRTGNRYGRFPRGAAGTRGAVPWRHIGPGRNSGSRSDIRAAHDRATSRRGSVASSEPARRCPAGIRGGAHRARSTAPPPVRDRRMRRAHPVRSGKAPGATSTVLWQSYAASLMRSARSRSRAARRGAGPAAVLCPIGRAARRPSSPVSTGMSPKPLPSSGGSTIADTTRNVSNRKPQAEANRAAKTGSHSSPRPGGSRSRTLATASTQDRSGLSWSAAQSDGHRLRRGTRRRSSCRYTGLRTVSACASVQTRWKKALSAGERRRSSTPARAGGSAAWRRWDSVRGEAVESRRTAECAPPLSTGSRRREGRSRPCTGARPPGGSTRNDRADP